MPTTALASALKTKQKEGKLSISALAKAIGANVQSVTGVLKGRSVPNKTTAPKYAKFLGLSPEDVAALTKPAAAKSTPKHRKAKRARKGKAGRKATGYQKAQKDEQNFDRLPVAEKPTASRISISLDEAVELAHDALAVATHRATAAQRKIITAVLAN